MPVKSLAQDPLRSAPIYGIIKESKNDTDMTIDQAIQILSYAKGPYGGTFVAAITGNLIEDIMMEDCIGKTFHRFGDKTIIQGHNLIPLAQWEQREQERRLNDIADLIFD